jgi:hypothetical protein
MTQRSILSGKNPQVIVRAGADVTVKGWEGDRILADASDPWGLQIKHRNEAIEVNVGGNGQVLVPFESSVTVYAGKSAQVEGIQGVVSAYSGAGLQFLHVHTLAQASAGKGLEIDCRRLQGTELKFSAGQDLRCRVEEDENLHYVINDLGGKWETVFGSGRVMVSLNAGGNVTLVTLQEAAGQPPHYILGKIERPSTES